MLTETLDAIRDYFGLRSGVSQSISTLNSSDFFGPVSTTYASKRVDPMSAQGVTYVYSAIGIISDSVATLPLVMYSRNGDTKGERARNHPLFRVLHDRANPEMDAMVFRELLTSHLCAYGNAYAEIQRDKTGRRVQALWPLRPDRMEVTDAGEYIYRLDDNTSTKLEREQVFHLRLRGDARVGWSPIRVAREAIGLSMAAEEYGGRFFANDATPRTVLKHPGKLSDDAHERVKRSWEDSQKGLSNAHRTALLEEGMEVTGIGLPPEDAQFMETRKFQGSEVARIFRIPPHMLMDIEKSTSWGTGIEQQRIGFQVFTLRAYTKRWEFGSQQQLLHESERDRYVIEHIIDDLLSADSQTRSQVYSSAITSGWMTRNEVRTRENMQPLDGLDTVLVPVNVAQEAGVGSLVEAVAGLVQAGFDPAAALDVVGLPPIDHLGLAPVTVQSDEGGGVRIDNFRIDEKAAEQISDGVALGAAIVVDDVVDARDDIKQAITRQAQRDKAHTDERVDKLEVSVNQLMKAEEQRLLPVIQSIERDADGRPRRVVNRQGDRVTTKTVGRDDRGNITLVSEEVA